MDSFTRPNLCSNIFFAFAFLHNHFDAGILFADKERRIMNFKNEPSLRNSDSLIQLTFSKV